MNDVVVQFLSGLDRDEGSETAYMETSSNEQTKDIGFRESNETIYATFQSEIHKYNKELISLLNPL
jgi:hypothetical protein